MDCHFSSAHIFIPLSDEDVGGTLINKECLKKNSYRKVGMKTSDIHERSAEIARSPSAPASACGRTPEHRLARFPREYFRGMLRMKTTPFAFLTL